jgi:crotonobetainyl-CoA:carnitine CoA-transferase CaiB-like acyl-CoA transferase
VACAKVQRIDEVLADPQIIARGMVIEQEHPILGKIRMPNLPFRTTDHDAPAPCAAPLLGQHNRDVAANLGYATADIDTLVRDGVLYAEPAVANL